MRDPRSYLFVPGDRPERFAKAAASGADAIILDLEDAVGPAGKDSAREHVAAWFAGGGTGIVRINGADSPWFRADLDMLARCGASGVMTPKADPVSVGLVAARVPECPQTALVETVAGLASLRETARISGVARLAFGNVDFGADARIPAGGNALDPVRLEVVLASRLADLPPPVDGVTVEIGDEAALAADVTRARATGFTGKLCIHPRQIEAVNAGLSPSEAEVAWARRVLAALEGAGGAVVQVDGKMVDRPMITQAQRVLAAIGC